MNNPILAAVASALLWAISVPVVAAGIKRIPEEYKYEGLGLGLFTSLGAGTLVLWAINRTANFESAELTLPIFFAAVFMFPVGTGLYYLCGHAFQGRMEVAAQFSKIKPSVSVLLAILFLREQVTFGILLSFVLVTIGIIWLIRLNVRWEENRWLPVSIGLLTALSWALGDMFMKVASVSGVPCASTTLSMLWVGSATVLAVVAPFLVRRPAVFREYFRFFIPFGLHGIFSFALAYTLFCAALSELGLTQTVLITCFWPLLGVLIVYLLDYFQGVKRKLSDWNLVYAALFILSGAIVALVL